MLNVIEVKNIDTDVNLEHFEKFAGFFPSRLNATIKDSLTIDQKSSIRDINKFIDEIDVSKTFRNVIYNEEFSDQSFINGQDKLIIKMHLLANDFKKEHVNMIDDTFLGNRFKSSLDRVSTKLSKLRLERAPSFKNNILLISSLGYFNKFRNQLNNFELSKSHAQTILDNEDRHIDRIVNYVDQLILSDRFIETFNILAPYLTANSYYNKIVYNCDTTHISLKLNKNDFDKYAFSSIYEFFNNSQYTEIQSTLISTNFRFIEFIRSEDKKTVNHIEFLTEHTERNTEYTIAFDNERSQLIRLSGEDILSTEIIIGEVLGIVGNPSNYREVINKKHIDSEVELTDIENSKFNNYEDFEGSIERAKEMFYSILDINQAKIYEQNGYTFIEGEEYYYLLTNQLQFNSLIRFKKDIKTINFKNLSNFETLCIYSDSSIPKYDTLASIALHIKAGAENVIEKRSNKFSLNSNSKEILKDFLKNILNNKIHLGNTSLALT